VAPAADVLPALQVWIRESVKAAEVCTLTSVARQCPVRLASTARHTQMQHAVFGIADNVP